MAKNSRLNNLVFLFARYVFSYTIIFSLAFSSPYAAASSSDSYDTSRSAPRIDFESTLNAQTLGSMGFKDGQIQFLQTQSTRNGEKVEIDVLRGELEQESVHNVRKLLEHLAPQIRKVHEANPDSRFQFNYISEQGETALDVTAQEILSVLRDIDPDTRTNEEKIDSVISTKLKAILNKTFSSETYSDATRRAFDKTTKNDVMWALMRFVAAGGSTTWAFTLSDIPLPTAMVLGVSLGAASGGFGLFIEKFTGWLDNNKTIPGRKLNYITSKETLMLLAPLLIGLQGTGIATPEGAALLGGYSTATVLAQNIYYQIKKRSPSAAMWYKWYAVEALFLSIPYFMLPMWDIYTRSVVEAITATFAYSLFSMASQGMWDLFLTSVRRPHLEAAIKRDLSELAERLKGVDITKLTPRELDAITKREEFKVRAPYKKYFFAGSILSVTSAVAGNAGAYMQSPALEISGQAGLLLLGSTSLILWTTHVIKNKLKARKSKANIESVITPRSERPTGLTCSGLFNM